MLAGSAVISGLVICPVDIREVKIFSYDYIRGSEFSSKLFHNLSKNFGGVQLQRCHERL